ncbi:MAG: hypothetical protein ACTFAL_09605 [Candidatus Electronema sp. V4]|uniref:hypothetical protein n=1 Tax=Candidatus Electronema sp. V4 TaxID=3454756 RepID=UPI0040553723
MNSSEFKTLRGCATGIPRPFLFSGKNVFKQLPLNVAQSLKSACHIKPSRKNGQINKALGLAG